MSNITERKNFKVVITGTFLLSANAGFIGALSLAGLHAATLAHITGDVIKTSIYMTQMNPKTTVQMACVWMSFMFGASISGVLVGATRQFDMRRVYGVTLLIESLLLLLSLLCSTPEPFTGFRAGIWWAEYFTAMACGLQNAVTTTYSGFAVRTTHLTGCGTDIGMVIGHEVRIRTIKAYEEFRKSYKPLQEEVELADNVGDTTPKQPPNIEPSVLWRLKVLVPIFAGYIIGAMVGGAAYYKWKNMAMMAPILFTGFLGCIYSILTPGF